MIQTLQNIIMGILIFVGVTFVVGLYIGVWYSAFRSEVFATKKARMILILLFVISLLGIIGQGLDLLK